LLAPQRRCAVPGGLAHPSRPQACVERITAKGAGECEPYYFDFLKCVDKCVAPKAFADLR